MTQKGNMDDIELVFSDTDSEQDNPPKIIDKSHQLSHDISESLPPKKGKQGNRAPKTPKQLESAKQNLEKARQKRQQLKEEREIERKELEAYRQEKQTKKRNHVVMEDEDSYSDYTDDDYDDYPPPRRQKGKSNKEPKEPKEPKLTKSEEKLMMKMEKIEGYIHELNNAKKQKRSIHKTVVVQPPPAIQYPIQQQIGGVNKDHLSNLKNGIILDIF